MQAVAQAAADPLFRSAQNFYADRLYFSPSQVLAKQYGIRCAPACSLPVKPLATLFIHHTYLLCPQIMTSLPQLSLLLCPLTFRPLLPLQLTGWP